MHAGMTDAAIATKCSSSLKFEAALSAQAACECSHPQLRQMFQQASQEAIQTQGRLAQLMIQRGWYVPLMSMGQNAGQFQQNLQTMAMETMNITTGGALMTPGAMAQGAGPAGGYQPPRV